jgi:hypothetical protein
MKRRTLAQLLFAAPALYACSAASTPSGPTWTCAQIAVPNGQTTECTATTTASVTGTFTCNDGGDYNPSCPPAGAGGDGGTTDFNPDGAVGSGNDGGTSDFGSDSGGGSDGGGGAGGGSDGGGGADGGTSDGVPDSGGWTPPGHGGTPPGHGGGGGSDGGGDGGDSTPPGPPGGGGPPGQGGDGGPPGWVCQGNDHQIDCQQPPKCDPGSHPAACGACIPDSNTTDGDCIPPSSGGCWVTGGGFIEPAASNVSFGGNAMPMKSGAVRGQWESIDHASGGNLHGEASYLVCRHVNEPGPGNPSGPQHNFDINQAYFGGDARWNGTDGYWFDVMVEDHGEPGNASSHKAGVTPDYYHVTVRQMLGAAQSGQVVFDAEGELVGGNIQIHPPNGGHPYSSSTLPPWVSYQP